MSDDLVVLDQRVVGVECPDPRVADRPRRIGQSATAEVAGDDEVAGDQGAVGADRDDPVALDPADAIVEHADAAGGLRPGLARERPAATRDADDEDSAAADCGDPVVLDHEVREAPDAGPVRVALDAAAAAVVLVEVAADAVDLHPAHRHPAHRLPRGDQVDPALLAGAVTGVGHVELFERRVGGVVQADPVLPTRLDPRRLAAAIGEDERRLLLEPPPLRSRVPLQDEPRRSSSLEPGSSGIADASASVASGCAAVPSAPAEGAPQST